VGKRRLQLSPWLLLAAIATATPSAQAQSIALPARTCGSASSVPLLLVNEAGADRATIDVTMRESEAIWAAAGVRLVWRVWNRPGDSSGFDGPFVMVRRRLRSRAHEAAYDRDRRAQLGRVVFDRDDRPTRLVEVSLTDIVAAVSRADRTKAYRSMALTRSELIGRALGRVVAHEIGHWLFGRGHAADGLMSAGLRPTDLVSPKRPAVAALWLAARADRLQDSLARCGVAGNHASAR